MGSVDGQLWSRAFDLFQPNSHGRLGLMTVVESNGSVQFEDHEIVSVESLLRSLPPQDCKIERQATFYFVSQKCSWGRLDISREIFEQLIAAHRVFAPYLQCVGAFGMKIRDEYHEWSKFRNSFGEAPGMAASLSGIFRYFEVCYNLPFVALNGRDRGSPWSLRKIGVYQQYFVDKCTSSWILVGKIDDVRTELVEQLSNSKNVQAWKNEHPMVPHLTIIAKLAIGWSRYLEYLQDELHVLDEKACFASVEPARPYDYGIGFTDCQNLQLLQNKILKTASALDSCLDVTQGCLNHYHELGKIEHHLAYSGRGLLLGLKTHESQLSVYRRSTDRTLERSYGTGSEQLSKILEHRNASLMREANREAQVNLQMLSLVASNIERESTAMVELARRTQEDSRILKRLSRVATVFLPATLLATIFSSSLVQSEPYGNETPRPKTRFFLASQFWVYIVATGLLTAAMMMLTIVLDCRRGRRLCLAMYRMWHGLRYSWT